jgi:hypothetical protein
MYKPITNYQLLITICLLLLFPFAALADEFRLVPSVAAQQEYSDNIYFDPKSGNTPTRDWISTFTPKLEMVRNTEKVSMNLSSRIDQRYYWSNNQLNATDQYYQGSLNYSVNEKLSFAGRGNYIQDSRPDRDILTTGLALTTSTRRQSIAGFTGQYGLTERTLTNLSYDYYKYTWDSPKYSDMESHTLGLGLISDVDNLIKETKVTGNVGYTHYRFTGMEMDNYQATVGLISQLNEKWSASGNAGPRYSISKFSAGTYQTQTLPPFNVPVNVFVAEDKTSYGAGWTGQLALSYKGEASNADISISREITPAYGSVGTLERGAFSLNLKRRFTYELSGTLSASYFRNRSSAGQSSAQRFNYLTANIAPGLLYEFTKDVSMEASYTYTKVNNNVYNTVADRNLFMIRLYVQHKLFE